MKNLRSGIAQLRRVHLRERDTLLWIVLLAFALRAYQLGAQAIWWDESLSLYRATRDLATILANTILIQNVMTHDLQPPLYFALLHYLVRATGTSEFALRFLSLAANVATVPLVYVLARRWFAPPVARLAALLGALSPFYVWYAQEARPYALVLFFSLLGTVALTHAFERDHQVPGAPKPGQPEAVDFRHFSPTTPAWIALYLLTTIASLYTNYYAVFLIPFHVVLIAILVWRSPRARPFILLPAIPCAAAAFLIPLIAAGASENVVNGPKAVPMEVIARDLLNSFSVGITIDLSQAFWIDLALLGLFLIGLVAFRSGGLFVLAYLAVPLAGLAAASVIRPLYQNSRYLIAFSPPFYLGVAAGMVALTQRWKWLAVPAFGVFLIGAVLSLDNWYFDPRYGKDDNRAWADYVREHARPGDFLILDSPHTEELYRYYAGDVVPIATLPVINADHTASPAADLTVVRNSLSQHSRVWFLQMDAAFDDPEARIEKLLGQNGVLLDETPFHGTSTAISLSLYAASLPIVPASQIQHPLDIAFAGHLHLRGYAAPPSIEPGARGIVQLYWQIDEPVAEDYVVSLRVVDAAGKQWGLWDSVPLGNRAGASTWPPGKIIADAHDLPISAGLRPGTYHLQVVPYHPATGNALGDVVTLGDLQVALEQGNEAP